MKFDLNETERQIRSKAEQSFGLKKDQVLDCCIKIVVTVYFEHKTKAKPEYFLKNSPGLNRIFQQILKKCKGVVWAESSRVCEVVMSKEIGEKSSVFVEVGLLSDFAGCYVKNE